MRKHRRLGLVAAAAFSLAALGATLLVPREPVAAKPKSLAYDPKSKPFGKSMKTWSVEWNQWNQSFPAAVHPLLDTTGERASYGQRGPVWFLGGPIGIGSVVTRTITIPSGKALFFPIVNGGADETVPGLLGAPISAFRQYGNDFVAQVDMTQTSVSVDGVPIQHLEKWRFQSDPFDFWLPADNVFEYFEIVAPRGVYRPAVSDGYWMMLKPLPLGQHTLHFASAVGAPQTFVFEATYEITVVDHDKP